MSRYKITPTDVLYFRDGREMHASESYTGSAMFPPPLPTLYGALRSAILSSAGADFSSKGDDFGLAGTPTSRVAGTKINYGTLRIKEFGLSVDGETLHAVPSDVRLVKSVTKKDAARYLVLKPLAVPADSLISGALPWMAGADGNEPMTESAGYMKNADFGSYLDKGKAPEVVVPSSELWITESRTHVAINPETQTAAESKLFSIPFVRFKKNTAMMVDLDGDEGLLGDSGWLKLGGEGRAAHYERIPDSKSLNSVSMSSGRIRVVLNSQAPFTQGWLPDGWSSASSFDFFGAKATLIGSVIGRYGVVGGWDLALKRPKPTRRAVPIGSVYYLDIVGELDKSILNHSSLCSEPDDIKSGFGTFHLGRI